MSQQTLQIVQVYDNEALVESQLLSTPEGKSRIWYERIRGRQ